MEWTHELVCRDNCCFSHVQCITSRAVYHIDTGICFRLVWFFSVKCNILTSTIITGAGCSSEVERSLMVRWVVVMVDPLSYFSFQPVLHDWCNKGRGMFYPVCGMVNIKEPLLLIEKSNPCGGSGFHLSLSEWSFTICLKPYNRK